MVSKHQFDVKKLRLIPFTKVETVLILVKLLKNGSLTLDGRGRFEKRESSDGQINSL